MARPKKDMKQTVQKEYPEFVATVDGASVNELEKQLSTYAKHQNEIEASQEADEGLEDARNQVTELSGPYKDAKKAVKLKMKYIISLIGEKGGNV